MRILKYLGLRLDSKIRSYEDERMTLEQALELSHNIDNLPLAQLMRIEALIGSMQRLSMAALRSDQLSKLQPPPEEGPKPDTGGQYL